jgi:hypothetical protein
MDATIVKAPSAARCSRIQQVLIREPAFKTLLGPKTVAVKRRDEVVENYPVSIVEIVARLQAAGIDANSCTRDEILDEAKNYFSTSEKITAEEVPPSITLKPEIDRSVLADYACLGVYGLLCSAKMLAEQDRKPGAAGRLQVLQKAIDVYQPLAVNIAHKANAA